MRFRTMETVVDKIKFAIAFVKHFTSVMFPSKWDLVRVIPVYMKYIGFVSWMFETRHKTMGGDSTPLEKKRDR